MPDEDESQEVSANKRRRIALACKACRTRKSRCNGTRPKCSLCESLGIECMYEVSDSSANLIVRKEHMVSLEQRLAALEKQVRFHERVLGAEKSPTISSKAPENSSSQVHFDGRTDEIYLNEDELQEVPSEATVTDGMAVSFVGEEDSGFFGPSSNIAVMRHITRAMTASGSAHELVTPTMSDDLRVLDNGVVSVSRPLSPLHSTDAKDKKPEEDVNIYVLPPETEIRDLIARYFSNTGLLFPYIHETSFLETYEQMRADDFRKVRRTWLGLLNMVLAMAKNLSLYHDKPAEERIASSDVFYQRASGLCKRQILRGSSLETVQYLLLMSQYLQGTQKSIQTWTIHGLAVKAALSLGLHSSDASRKLPPIEREIRKRTWFGCVVLDRSLSMTFGRPSAIPEDYILLALPEVLEDEAASALKTHAIQFYKSTITLYKVMYKIVSTLYGQNLGCGHSMNEMEMITQIFRLEQELDQWRHDQPAHLSMYSPGDVTLNESSGPYLDRFRVILTLRVLNLQVLLHRPALARALNSRNANARQAKVPRSIDQTELNCLQICVSSAEEIIALVNFLVAAQAKGRERLGAWWFSLYYTFNAALMIFGSLLALPKYSTARDSMPDHISRGKRYISEAVQALEGLDHGNRIITRCAGYLRHILQIIETWNPANAPAENPIETSEVPHQVFQNPEFGAFSQSMLISMTQQPGSLDLGEFLDNDLGMGQFFMPTNAGSW